MSRGEDVTIGSRQNGARYLQMSESLRVNKSGRKKAFNEKKAQSQKLHANNFIGVSKQLYLEDLPGYFYQNGQPIEQPYQQQNSQTSVSRSRIAEVVALSGYQSLTKAPKDKKDKKGWAERVGVDGGGSGHQHRSVPESTTREPATNDLYRLGASANVDLVHTAVLNFKSLRKSERRSLDTLDGDMASTRGPNVSILHLRGPPGPWDPPITTFADSGGSLRSAPKINTFRTGRGQLPPLTFQNEIPIGQHTDSLPSNCRKRDTNSVSLFITSSNGSGNVNAANRELSPVRWCDREVDGVYLGRSGWVQVQQRSLDDSRRPLAGGQTVTVSSTLPNRVKLTHYHSNSESGDHAPSRPRPDYLPLPAEVTRNQKNQKASALLLQEYDSLSPPSITPIISPPPAFQDPGSEANFHASRNHSGKSPYLSRSKAIIDESPPNSPPNCNSRSTGSLNRYKRLTPSPQQHVLLNSHAKSFEDNLSFRARRNQFQRFNESSTSSSSSSFGFRSLDGSVGRSTAMPRVDESDSSLEGYDDEDGDEDLGRSRSRIKSPPFLNGERVSPNPSRHGNSRNHAGRRTPSSDSNGKKFGHRSSFSSDSSCERNSPNSSFRRSSHRQSRDSHVNPWDVRNSRVRRSRSLQLPEKRSPSVTGVATPSSSGGSREHLSPDYPSYYKNGVPNPGPYRVVVKVNGEALNTPERPRRVASKKTPSETSKYEEMRREEEEEETRIITEYLNSKRSRAAARDLLMHRYMSRPDEGSARESPVDREAAADPLFSVYFSGSRRSLQKGPQQWTSNQQGYAAKSPGNPNPCNPSTCDFWPHCAHRDAISYGKQMVTSPPNMKSSQSYPSSNQRKPEKPRKDDKQQRQQPNENRSSPASLESVSDLDPRKSVRSSPSDKRRSPCQSATHRHNGDKIRSKFDNVDIDGHVGVARSQEPNRKFGSSSGSSSSSDVYVPTPDKFARGTRTQKTSEASTPMEGYESASSKSPLRDRKSDVMFSLRPGSAPTNDTDEDLTALDAQRRSLSLPKSFLSNGYKNSKQRRRRERLLQLEPSSQVTAAYFLPSRRLLLEWPGYKVDCFTSCSSTGVFPFLYEVLRSARLARSRIPVFPDVPRFPPVLERPLLIRGLFPWRRQFAGTTARPRPLTPETTKTAPATPIRDPSTGNKDRAKSMQYVRSSSTPMLDEPSNVASEWDLRRDISQGTEECTKEARTNQKELLGQRNILGNQTSESVLQKFKKSFSLRFHKSQKGGSLKDEVEDVDDLTEDVHEEEDQRQQEQPQQQTVEQKNGARSQITKDDDQKFRFGPLVWRSSKERKKGKKAVRNAKCNSGDSGIQIESSLNLPGDSSESHDTDEQDDLDSPPVVRRRAASTEKSRPQSEVINQILIDKFKADLQWRAQAKGYPNRRVRRTNSDLGGQRLFNWELRNTYKRMLSTPSPVKGRSSRPNSRKPSPEGPAAIRHRRLPGRAQLRRSMSQPLGLNELSPLMRRKASVVRNQVLSEDEHDGRGATSDDEALSDSESSVTSLNDRKKSFEAAMDEEMVILAEAVWDHVAMEPEELAFRAGDVIEVLDTLDRDWWWGATGDNYGWFPSAFVRLRVSQEDTVEDCLEAMASGAKTSKKLRRRTSISLLSNDQVRSSVVRELLNTERDFVKVIRDVTEGYIAECRRRTDMFSPSQIETIFGNLEELLTFQTRFLEDLEVRIDREAPHRSCVGEIFLKHRSGFRMYSEYCNSHPMAIATLQELYQRSSYSKFFEACRLMRGLIEIPLDGYLLTPVQRICKYPLQLAELLKYTKPEHPDHHHVKEALETMRGVAVLINERKRRMESLEKLAAWQQRVEAWEGEDLIEASTQLIYQGEVVRVTSGMWTSNVTLFLFDHQLVYCKKDILKRNTYVYKGRICMDTSEIIDIPDGKDPQSGVTIRHGLKIYSCVRDKWLLFCCRSGEEKMKWLEALSEERKLVAQDRQSGLELPPAARQLARMAARSKRRPPNEPRSKTYKRESHYNGYKVGRKVGTWFTFGGAKKSSRMNLRTRNAPQHVT